MSMTPVLRVEMIFLAVLAVALVVHTVNRRQLLLKYSLIWLLISLLFIVTACFPQIAFAATRWAGFETPSNLIFFLAILSLLGICFSLTVIVSRQTEKLKRMIQLVSLDRCEWKGQEDDDTEGE